MPKPKRKIYCNNIWRVPCFEPVKRNKDGLQWIMHRFPIKGGISMRDIWLIEMSKPNQLMKMVRIIDA
jgi:hypothetical protein